MAGVNKVILLGRLGRDPEVSYTQAGMAVCKFSMATSKKRQDGNEVTSWHRCTAFGKTGEIIAQYVNKGQQLYVEGELSYGQYEKDGITHYTTDIIVREFNFIGGGSGGGNTGGYGNQNQNQNQGGFGGGYQQQGAPQGGGFQQQPPQGGGQFQQPQNNFGGAPAPQGNPSQPGSDFSQTPPDDDIPF